MEVFGQSALVDTAGVFEGVGYVRWIGDEQSETVYLPPESLVEDLSSDGSGDIVDRFWEAVDRGGLFAIGDTYAFVCPPCRVQRTLEQLEFLGKGGHVPDAEIRESCLAYGKLYTDVRRTPLAR